MEISNAFLRKLFQNTPVLVGVGTTALFIVFSSVGAMVSLALGATAGGIYAAIAHRTERYTNLRRPS